MPFVGVKKSDLEENYQDLVCWSLSMSNQSDSMSHKGIAYYSKYRKYRAYNFITFFFYFIHDPVLVKSKLVRKMLSVDNLFS